MQNYTYKSRSDAWICAQCSALVDDPQRHEEAHRELVRVLHAWADVLDQPHLGAKSLPPGPVPDLQRDSPGAVPAVPSYGSADPVDRALEATQYTTLGRGDVVDEP